MRRILVLSVAVTVGVMSMVLAGYQAPPAQGPKVIDMQHVKDNLYVFLSSSPANPAAFSGGNVAALVTDTGVILVDTKLAGWGQTLLEKIRTVTDKPITTIINTHTHGDHTGNNEFFGANVESITQEDTAAHMAKMDAFKGDKVKFLPKKTFKDRLSIGSGKNRIDLYYFGAGHTSGDTWVVFPALRVLHAGDMFAWKDAPLCDRSNGGSCVAFPVTLKKALDGTSDADVVIGGHQPLTTRQALQEYQRYMTELLSLTQDAIKAGKSVDEAVASINLTAKYKGYESMRVKGAVQAIYDELKK